MSPVWSADNTIRLQELGRDAKTALAVSQQLLDTHMQDIIARAVSDLEASPSRLDGTRAISYFAALSALRRFRSELEHTVRRGEQATARMHGVPFSEQPSH